MEILRQSIRATPLYEALVELDAAEAWQGIDSENVEALMITARGLVGRYAEASEIERSWLDTDLTRFLVKFGAPWGLAVLTDLPDIEPRRAFLLVAELMGKTVRFADEGDYLIEIKEDPAVLVARPGFNNSKEFFPHTDLSYVSEPPVFFCLHSIVNEREQGGFSEFVDIRDVVQLLDGALVSELRNPDFLFPAPMHYGSGSVRQAILSTNRLGVDEVRFRRDNLRCASRSGIDAVVALCRTIQDTMTEVFLEPGSIAVIDNRRVLHGRTAFLGGALARSPRHINRLYFEPDEFEPRDGAYCD